MMTLLKLEWLKIKSSRYFPIVLGLYLVIMALMAVYWIKMDKVAVKYPVIWENFAFVTTIFNVLIGLIVIISITSEYQHKTYRQHIIDGLSRGRFFMSKIITVLLVAILLSLFIMALVLIMGQQPLGAEVPVFKGVVSIFYYFLHILGYMSMAFFLAVLIRSNGIAIAIYIMYVYILEMLIRNFIQYSPTKNPHLVDFFPKNVFASLIPEPGLSKVVASTISKPNAIPHDSLVLLAIAYILIFFGASYALLLKRDIK